MSESITEKDSPRRSNIKNTTDYNSVADVIILTAVTIEYKAAKLVDAGALTQWNEKLTEQGLPIATRSYQGKNRSTLRVVLTQAGDMGMIAAVAALVPLIEQYKPRCIAMCGVCAGRSDKVNLGDVIAADRLYVHDAGKKLPDHTQQDLKTFNLRDDWKLALERFEPISHFKGQQWWENRPIPYSWQENWVLAKLLSGMSNPGVDEGSHLHCPDWELIIANLWKSGDIHSGALTLTAQGKERIQRILYQYRNDLPDLSPSGSHFPFRLHVAPMGSGNQVIEDQGVWSFISVHMRKTLGIEMEAAALGAIAHSLRQRSMDVLVMKGIMDFADHGRGDHFKNYAARASAECLMQFLRDQYDNSNFSHTNLQEIHYGEFSSRGTCSEGLAVELPAERAMLRDIINDCFPTMPELDEYLVDYHADFSRNYKPIINASRQDVLNAFIGNVDVPLIINTLQLARPAMRISRKAELRYIYQDNQQHDIIAEVLRTTFLVDNLKSDWRKEFSVLSRGSSRKKLMLKFKDQIVRIEFDKPGKDEHGHNTIFFRDIQFKNMDVAAFRWNPSGRSQSQTQFSVQIASSVDEITVILTTESPSRLVIRIFPA